MDKWKNIRREHSPEAEVRIQRQRKLLAMPWWQRLIAGDPTAVPAGWEQEDGSLKFSGEEAAEFVCLLEGQTVQLPLRIRKAYDEYMGRAGGLDAQPEDSGVSGSD